MRIRRNYVRALGSILIPVLATFALVGWAEQQVRFTGGQGANAPAVATATLSAYPLPSQPAGPSSGKPTSTPTRLAAYPLPGPTPTPTKSQSGAGPLSVQTDTLTYTLFLPIIRNDCYFKGTAGVTMTAQPGDLMYTNTLAMGVCSGYEWDHVYSPTYIAYSEPWQVINDVRSRIISPSTVVTWHIWIDGGACPGANGLDTSTAGQAAMGECVHWIAASRPGMYWLIWNEPDDGGQDNFSPAQGAQFFRQISNTILSGDSTAKLIVGNVLNLYRGTDPEHGCPDPRPEIPGHYGCGVHWLTQFISEALVLGYDPRPYIAGYGFHVYSQYTYVLPPNCDPLHPEYECHDLPLLASFTNSVLTDVNWLAVNDAGKEVWLTEINWVAKDPTNWDTQTRRMSQICSTLTTLPINRYFWFDGGWPWETGLITVSLFTDGSGALSPAGQRFALPPDPASGGCPIWR